MKASTRVPEMFLVRQLLSGPSQGSSSAGAPLGRLQSKWTDDTTPLTPKGEPGCWPEVLGPSGSLVALRTSGRGDLCQGWTSREVGPSPHLYLESPCKPQSALRHGSGLLNTLGFLPTVKAGPAPGTLVLKCSFHWVKGSVFVWGDF